MHARDASPSLDGLAEEIFRDAFPAVQPAMVGWATHGFVLGDLASNPLDTPLKLAFTAVTLGLGWVALDLLGLRFRNRETLTLVAVADRRLYMADVRVVALGKRQAVNAADLGKLAEEWRTFLACRRDGKPYAPGPFSDSSLFPKFATLHEGCVVREPEAYALAFQRRGWIEVKPQEGKPLSFELPTIDPALRPIRPLELAQAVGKGELLPGIEAVVGCVACDGASYFSAEVYDRIMADAELVKGVRSRTVPGNSGFVAAAMKTPPPFAAVVRAAAQEHLAREERSPARKVTSVLAAGAFAAAAAAYLATPYPIAAAIGAGLGALSLVFLGAAFADLRGARRLAAIAQASPGDAEPAAPGLRPGAA